jgi:LPS-assembly protein
LLHRRRAKLAAAVACLIVAHRAGAQGSCPAPIVNDYEAVDVAPLSEATIVTGQLLRDADGTRRMLSGFEIGYRGARITAGEAIQQAGSSSIEVLDEVRVAGEGFLAFAEAASIDRVTEVVTLEGAGINLTDESAQSARARAERIVITPSQLFSMSELSFTTCPEDDVDWEFRARSFEADWETGVGVLRGATLRLGPVPVFRSPYFSVPLTDARKSGFLAPKIAERDRTGFDLSVPYYVNLAPHYDLLLEPRFMEDRGAQIGSLFRYLLPASEGQLDVEYLPDDRLLDRERLFVNFGHESWFGQNLELVARIENVSDAAYFEDLGDTLGVISQTHLDRYVDLIYHAPRWTLLTRTKEYQTIDDQIAAADRPYERLPQMLFTGSWGDRLVAFESDVEAVNFDRPVGDTGWRFDSVHELRLQFTRAGYYVTPTVGFRQTNYRIDRTATTPVRTHSRGLPISTLDAGLRVERRAGSNAAWIHTIEPRMLYVHVPFEDQTALPIFDTILPDFNLVQLFRKDRFVGSDRVADADQVSAGLTTRLIRSASGRELLSATVGQTRARDPRRVMLPNEPPSDSTRSNYVAELAVSLSAKWNLDVGYQWNGETEETVRAETRFEFRPQDDRLFGVGYRLREGLLEQGDLSLIWPIGDRWRMIGQYSYSLLENKALERFAGIEYEACCWRLRITNRRYIVRSTGQTDSSISIQLELKGLARNRSSPEELLGSGILPRRRLQQ